MHLISATVVATTSWPDACVAMTLIVVCGFAFIAFIRSMP